MTRYGHNLGVVNGRIHLITALVPFSQDKVEVVERKGLGHPDTICDALACLLSAHYAQYTMSHCDGLVLHHQFDKVMLIGGKTEVTFGEIGRFLEPIRIIVAGRASTSYKGQPLPVEALIEETIHDYMQQHFLIPDLRRDLVIEHRWTNAAGPGTLKESKGAIATMFAPITASQVRGYGSHYVANDTSYGVAYAPLSALEQAILATEAYLNDISTKSQYPWLGTDIKLMGVRLESEVHLTVCIPQIARYVSSLTAYKENLATAVELILTIAQPYLAEVPIQLSLNTKDNYDDMNLYLTVTGASLSGDIGVVGRGNRVNGLITANRPMSLEGAAGKNPRYYSGIIYNLAARYISEQLYQATKLANRVEIVSQNGAPLLNPWQVIVTSEVEDKMAVEAIVQAGLAHIPALSEQFIRGEIKVY